MHLTDSEIKYGYYQGKLVLKILKATRFTEKNTLFPFVDQRLVVSLPVFTRMGYYSYCDKNMWKSLFSSQPGQTR